MLRRSRTSGDVSARAELEAEVEFLRESLVTTKLENAQLKGELDELRHDYKALQQQQQQQAMRRSKSLSFSLPMKGTFACRGGAEGSLTEASTDTHETAIVDPVDTSSPAPAPAHIQPVDSDDDRAQIRLILSRRKCLTLLNSHSR